MSNLQGLSSYIHVCDSIEERTCPACDDIFSTVQGRNSHLAQSKRCAWYRKGKNADFSMLHIANEDLDSDSDADSDLDDNLPVNWDDSNGGNEIDDMEQPHSPVPSTSQVTLDSINEEHPLQNNQTTVVTEPHQTGGKMQGRKDHLHEQWANHLGVDPTNPFLPFKSEVDWRVAKWFIKDGPGISANDRLLEIPKVLQNQLIK